MISKLNNGTITCRKTIINNKTVIIDPFEENHAARREWRKLYENTKETASFNAVYENNNQLRRTNLTFPVTGMDILATQLKHIPQELHTFIKEKGDSWWEIIATEKYPGMELEGKIQVVQEIENDSIAILNNLFPDNPKETIKIT